MSIPLLQVSRSDKETHRMERELPNNFLLTSITLSLFVIIVGFMFAISAISDSSLNPHGALIFAIVVCGGLGGTLLGIRRADGVLQLPTEEKNRITIGVIGDAAQGAAGAIIIFLLIPYEISNKTAPLETMNFVKLLALALLGGYAGPYLFDLALSRTLASLKKDVDDVKATTKVLVEKDKTDAEALKLFEKHLSTPGENTENVEKLKQAILGCSSKMKVLIFVKASAIRRENWNSDNPYNRRKIERAIPIFEALCDSVDDDLKHVCYSELGYIYKDKKIPDWNKAYKFLTQAIDLRANSTPLSGRYELNRAMCGIMLGYGDEEIRRDLEAARHYEKDQEIIVDLCKGTNEKLATSTNGKLAQWLKREGLCDCHQANLV